jgi:hypothetical protein
MIIKWAEVLIFLFCTTAPRVSKLLGHQGLKITDESFKPTNQGNKSDDPSPASKQYYSADKENGQELIRKNQRQRDRFACTTVSRVKEALAEAFCSYQQHLYHDSDTEENHVNNVNNVDLINNVDSTFHVQQC